MGDAPLAVLDSSVGVKWVKPEAGREEARSLLASHRDGAIRVVVASHFLHEVVAVAVRRGGADMGEATWDALRLAGLTVVSLDGTLARDAFEQCRALGCTFYDSLAPALAIRLGARLYSADARAHARFEGVRLV